MLVEPLGIILSGLLFLADYFEPITFPQAVPVTITSGVNMSSAKHTLPNDGNDIWDRYEPLLRRLYVGEQKTLKEVKKIMETLHGFPEMP